jgi:predicted DNA-binding transcriptional regulator YafY
MHLPNTTAKPSRYSIRQRLTYIEEVLYWTDRVSRRDLQDKFGVSNQKAALDFADYLVAAPGNIVYNPNLKRYTPAAAFQPLFYQPDIESALRRRAKTEIAPAFERPLDPKIVRGLVLAANQKLRCRIRYRSMHTGSVRWRDVSPHAFVYNGERWHARAYDHTTAKWCDLVLGRVEASQVLPNHGEPCSADIDWDTEVTLTFEADRRLLSQQQRTLLRDYGASGRIIKLRVRRAMVYYVAARLGLLKHPVGRLNPLPKTRALLGTLQLPGYI